MKLRNKKSGKILNEVRSSMTYKDNIRLYDETSDEYYSYTSLAELNADWEDVPEEPKEYWYIDCDGEVYESTRLNKFDLDRMENIGNHFNSKEEAEKAVERLRAWKRLKEAGFIINSWNGNLGGGNHYDCCGQVNITAEVGDENKRNTAKSDLDLLFCTEEKNE